MLVNFLIPPLFFGSGTVAIWLNQKLEWWPTGLGPYGETEWFGTFFQIGIVFGIYHMIMKVWEKSNYRGSLEWALGTIGYYLVPGRKSERYKDLRWYQKGDISVQETFYNADWINVTEYSEEEYHRDGRDSRLVLILSICCLVFPLFIPITAGLFFIVLKTRKKEGKNRRNLIALILSIIGIVLTVAFFIVVNILTPTMLQLEI